MTEPEINEKIATLQKEKDYYVDLIQKSQQTLEPVSYTHLTLPTILLV